MLHMWFLSPHPIFVVVQSLSCVQLFVTPWTAACPASLSITNSQSLLKLVSIEFELKSITIHVGDAIQPSLPLSSPSPPCLQSFPASGSFLMSQLFESGGQSIEASASASVLTMNIQDWFPLGLTCLISLQSKGFSRVFYNTTSKASIFWYPDFFLVQLSHPYMTTGKTIAFTIQTNRAK